MCIRDRDNIRSQNKQASGLPLSEYAALDLGAKATQPILNGIQILQHRRPSHRHILLKLR